MKTPFLFHRSFFATCSTYKSSFTFSKPRRILTLQGCYYCRTNHFNSNNTSISSSRRSMSTKQTTLVSEPTKYEELVRKLYRTNWFNPVSLGLHNINRLHELLGHPMDREHLLLVHVAGTNGKGSVCTKIARTLTLAGYNTGLYTSPHISSFRERIKLNWSPISEHDVELYNPKIYDLAETNQIPATFFEITTALAFAFFDANKVDAVVLETGLGGRLDATNVAKCPSLTVITSIGLDHTKILGDTIELIAKEKAGIIKPHCPVLVGPNVPHDVIRDIAQPNESEYFVSDHELAATTTTISHLNSSNGLSENYSEVDFDLENSRIAQAAIHLLQQKHHPKLSVSESELQKGISIRPPCRFEEITIQANTTNVTVILDIAHNPAALKLLLSKLNQTYFKNNNNKNVRFVVGLSLNKNVTEFGTILLSYAHDPKQIHLVVASNPRAATMEHILHACPAMHASVSSSSNGDTNDNSVSAQMQLALNLAFSRGELVVVCGTVFIMSEVREALGLKEPRDSDYITEVEGSNYSNVLENFAGSDSIGSTTTTNVA